MPKDPDPRVFPENSRWYAACGAWDRMDTKPPETAKAPVGPDVAVAEAPPAPVPTITKREVVVATVMVAGGAFLTVALLAGRVAPSPAAAGEPAAAPPASASRAEAVVAPKWSAANRAVWVGNRRRAVAYEVDAENTINVWMRTVRPSLVVRCIGGRTEVFVVTNAAARLEPQTEDHTVTFAFDAGAATTALWPDSEDHDALFAPDGAALARRLTAARTFRFTFTPHNAPPANARFHVAGLEPLLTPAATDCGWTK